MESVKAVPPGMAAAQAELIERQKGTKRARSVVENTTQASQAGSDDTPSRVGELQRLAEQAFATDNLKLSIRYDETTGRFIYRGLHPETGEVMRQYPPEEVLERIAKLHASLAGVSVDKIS